jgi:hypothetical protein
MRVLTNDEAQEWCSERGLVLDSYSGVESPELPHNFECRGIKPKYCPLWTDRRCLRVLIEGKTAVAEALIRHLVGDQAYDGAVVWATDWPLYRPDEMAVMMRFRRSIGESRPLIEAPCHLFASNELDDCVGCFNLCIHFLWDAFLFVPSSGLVAYNSHDGILYISFLSEQGRSLLISIVGNYDLKMIGTD